jgi:hypothetical protein
MSTQRTPKSDKELWHSLAADQTVAPVPVSDLDFATWLEGRLSETQAARIDAAVSADPELRRAALELADILGKPLPAPSPRMAVPRPGVGRLRGRKADISRILAGRPVVRLRPGLRGAARVGRHGRRSYGSRLHAGGGLGETYATEKYASAQSGTVTVGKPLGRDTTNELNDLFADAT